MKNYTFITFLLFSFYTYAQDVLMQNGTVTQCMGTFYDSGGASGNYADDEDLVFTICPDNPGQWTQLNFSDFNIESTDVMLIYDGDSTSANAFGSYSGSGSANSPGRVSATANNASGCITIKFVSDASVNLSGWEASISCFTPCQTITSQLDSAMPTPNGDGYIRVCPDENITLTGSGNFSMSGAGASYEWDLGDGNTIAGQTASFSYPNPGVYIVNLNITDTNPTGCSNTNLINQVIQVATAPDFSETTAEEFTLCFGESTTITGIVNGVKFIDDCTPPISGTTFLPDGSGAVYQTCITVDCYDASQTLDDVSQLLEICVNMEHSYLGDLDINIISPNGQMAVLKQYPGGGSTYLGGPNDDANTTAPGVGANYCFSMSGTVTLENGPTQTAGTNPPGSSIVPGTYLPEGSFNTLLGSPLNGDWCIQIIDNLREDNGYIFSWGMNFDSTLQPVELSFTPVVTSQEWDADASITNIMGNTITVQPTTAGQHCYTYRATDDFGCEYSKEICIMVLPEIITASPNNLFLCNDGTPPYVFDLTQNDAVILAPSPNPADMVITYHKTLTEAMNDIGSIDVPEAYSGTDGQTIYVRAEYLDSGCYDSYTFTLNLFLQPEIDLEDNYTLCVNTNGSEVISPPLLDTGLSIAQYTFSWTRNGTLLVGQSGQTLSVNQPGIYTVEVTDRTTGCVSTDSAEVVVSAPPILEASVTSQAFADNNIIVAVASGEGTYEYSLDNGPWQESGTFENASAGPHTIIARDINGCGTSNQGVFVMNYPTYFTPNGDGYNDTWNIIGIADQPGAIIYIFDRYGKLLKQISPTGLGWNGTFNGNLMPTSDYWFTVHYNEPMSGETKEFKAHFTLKR